ncbi:NIPSNAP family containing protein [Hymenobacter sedentarius]|uniref:NIPSNAP family containing protein n=1 Tax=Hymenobacter sedentarius TaxID=1411621 RepID=A0A0U4AX12_9BACT|nr:NIPSNAP family protein [Hymenobacter sedentarius]ALW85277.1 NIPSNAP family containing protein [Hymenobacter sedentarius]
MKLLKPTLIMLCLICAGALGSLRGYGASPKRDLFALKIYHLQTNEQADRLDHYLQQAYLPALHRAGVSKVGVFKQNAQAAGAPAPTEQLVFVLIPCRSAQHYTKLNLGLEQDKAYQTDAQDYLKTAFDNPVYTRFETVLMLAFTGMPTFHLPALKASPAERVYELRSYEGASEALHQNKVAQFNNGEIGIFKRLNFNTVFCGQVIAGGKMPNLMYLSTFENQQDQEAHWQAFKNDAEWKTLSAMPAYAHNMLRMDKYMLHPAAYSEI